MMDYKKQFKDILQYILSNSKANKSWINTYFAELKQLSTTERGEVAEQFLESVLKPLNFEVKRAGSKRDSYDILINNKKIEVKQATLDVNSSFQFNGIRYHRDYDFLFVLGVSPEEIFFNIYTAADVKTQKIGKLIAMEKGVVGSHKLTKKPSELYNINLLKEVILKNL